MGRKLLVNNMTVNGAGPRTFFLVEIIVLVFTTSPPAQRREHAWVVWLLVTWHRTTCVFLCDLPFQRHIPAHLPLAGGVVVGLGRASQDRRAMTTLPGSRTMYLWSSPTTRRMAVELRRYGY